MNITRIIADLLKSKQVINSKKICKLLLFDQIYSYSTYTRRRLNAHHTLLFLISFYNIVRISIKYPRASSDYCPNNENSIAAAQITIVSLIDDGVLM